MYISKTVLVLFFVFVTLIGCASAPVDEAAEPELQQIPENYGRIFVYRLSGDADHISSAARIDGEPVGRASPGIFFYVDLPVGTYEFAAARNTHHVVAVDLKAGAVMNIRVDMWLRQSRWTLIPVLVSEETARAQMSGLNYKGQ